MCPEIDASGRNRAPRKKNKEQTDTLLGALEREAGLGERPATAIILRGLCHGESRASMVRQINGIYVEVKPANVLASHASDSGSTVEITSSSSSSPQQYQDWSLYYSSSTNDTDEGGNDDADGSPIVSLGSTSSNFPPLTNSPFRATDVIFDSPETSLSVPPGMPTLNSPSTTSTLFNSDQDTWTKRGLSRSYVRNLVESILAWDGLPLCICHRELFLAEFDSGARTYCSPTLVNVLLALAVTRMEGQQKNQSVLGGRSGGTPSLGGRDFLREALETCAFSQGRGAILDSLPIPRLLEYWQFTRCAPARMTTRLGNLSMSTRRRWPTSALARFHRHGRVAFLSRSVLTPSTVR